MADTSVPTQSPPPVPRPVFMDRDVAWSPEMRDFLRFCQDRGLVTVLWSANSSSDLYENLSSTPADGKNLARWQLTEIPDRLLDPLTSDQLRELFPGGEVRGWSHGIPEKFQGKDHQYRVWKDLTAVAVAADDHREPKPCDLLLLSHDRRHANLRPGLSDYESVYHFRFPPWSPTSFGEATTTVYRQNPEAMTAALRDYATQHSYQPEGASDPARPDDGVRALLDQLGNTHAGDIDLLRQQFETVTNPQPTRPRGVLGRAVRAVTGRLPGGGASRTSPRGARRFDRR
ncbi:MAG: hypothetical protein ACRDPW_04555 [Mycobacteriales bacterium]